MLTDTAVRNAKPKAKAYKVSDSLGLYLLVNPKGSKLWRLKYRMNGVERKLAIGPYPQFTLSEARAARDAARRQVAHAIDPNYAKRQARIEASLRAENSFAKVAGELIEKRQTEGVSPRTLEKYQWVLKLFSAEFVRRPVAEINPAELLHELKHQERRGKFETAKRMRSFASRVTGPAVTMQSLANKGLTRAEARDPLSYDKGDVVRFTRDYADKGVARGEAYRVERIDPAKAAIALKSEDGREVDWRLRQWGAGNSQTFAPQSLELKTGDRIRFTRNDREAGRINGARGEVIAIDAQARTAEIRNPRGQTQTLSLDVARDQHITHAYVETAFAAQGRTADHVIIHADSKATNLVNQKSFYVGISRAKESVAIFTNDRAKLVTAIGERAGQAQTAIAHAAMPTPAAGKAISAGLG